MSTSGRVQAEFTRLDQDMNADADTLSLEYEFPFVDISSSGRTVKHEPIGRSPVVQYMGPQIREITIEGHCYANEARYIDRLKENGLVDASTDRWSGIGVVDKVSTSATGEGGGPRGGTENRIYEYNLTVLEVTSNAPESVTG